MNTVPSPESLVEARKQLGITDVLAMTTDQALASIELAATLDQAKIEKKAALERAKEEQRQALLDARSRCAYADMYRSDDYPLCRNGDESGCDVCEERWRESVNLAYRNNRGCTD